MLHKIALHTHFDGSIDPGHACELKNGDIRHLLMSSAPSKTLGEYLQRFQVPLELMQTSKNLMDFAQLLALDLAHEGVIYAEIRFCPLLHLKEGLTPDEVIWAVQRGLKCVPTLRTNLILCMSRELSYAENAQILDLAAKYLGHGVCGLDMAGDEAAYPNKLFESLFRAARAKNIPLTIHAGEADSYESVNTALDYGAQRIGHGIRAIESAETVLRLAREHVPLEICVTSNLDTGAIQRWDEHPVRELFDEGVWVTIDTDNRTVSNTTLEQEYHVLQTTFGFTDADLLRCNLYAALSAFLPDADKVKLCQKLLTNFAQEQASKLNNL